MSDIESAEVQPLVAYLREGMGWMLVAPLYLGFTVEGLNNHGNTSDVDDNNYNKIDNDGNTKSVIVIVIIQTNEDTGLIITIVTVINH